MDKALNKSLNGVHEMTNTLLLLGYTLCLSSVGMMIGAALAYAFGG